VVLSASKTLDPDWLHPVVANQVNLVDRVFFHLLVATSAEYIELLVVGPEAHAASGLDLTLVFDFGPGEGVEALGVELEELVEADSFIIFFTNSPKYVEVLLDGSGAMTLSGPGLLTSVVVDLFELQSIHIEHLEVVLEFTLFPTEQEDAASDQGG